MFQSLFKIILFFFVIYFLYNTMKMLFNLLRRNALHGRARGEKTGERKKDDEKVIEIDKDHYKVE